MGRGPRARSPSQNSCPSFKLLPIWALPGRTCASNSGRTCPIVATPAEASGCCQRTLPATVGGREAGRRPKPLNFLVRGPVSRAPPAFLPRRQDGAVALGLTSRPGPGGSSPSRATVARPSPAPPPSPDPRFRTWVPARARPRIMREKEPAWSAVAKIFLTSASARHTHSAEGPSVFNRLPRGLACREKSPVANDGRDPIHAKRR